MTEGSKIQLIKPPFTADFFAFRGTIPPNSLIQQIGKRLKGHTRNNNPVLRKHPDDILQQVTDLKAYSGKLRRHLRNQGDSAKGVNIDSVREAFLTFLCSRYIIFCTNDPDCPFVYDHERLVMLVESLKNSSKAIPSLGCSPQEKLELLLGIKTADEASPILEKTPATPSKPPETLPEKVNATFSALCNKLLQARPELQELPSLLQKLAEAATAGDEKEALHTILEIAVLEEDAIQAATQTAEDEALSLMEESPTEQVDKDPLGAETSTVPNNPPDSADTSEEKSLAISTGPVELLEGKIDEYNPVMRVLKTQERQINVRLQQIRDQQERLRDAIADIEFSRSAYRRAKHFDMSSRLANEIKAAETHIQELEDQAIALAEPDISVQTALREIQTRIIMATNAKDAITRLIGQETADLDSFQIEVQLPDQLEIDLDRFESWQDHVVPGEYNEGEEEEEAEVIDFGLEADSNNNSDQPVCTSIPQTAKPAKLAPELSKGAAIKPKIKDLVTLELLQAVMLAAYEIKRPNSNQVRARTANVIHRSMVRAGILPGQNNDSEFAIGRAATINAMRTLADDGVKGILIGVNPTKTGWAYAIRPDKVTITPERHLNPEQKEAFLAQLRESDARYAKKK